MTELYETLYTTSLSLVEPGDLIAFAWIDEDGEPFIDEVHVIEIDVDSTIVLRGTSNVTGDTTTYEITDDIDVEVLGG